MHVFLAILLSVLGFVGPLGPDIGSLPTPQPGIDETPNQEWVTAGFIWDCKNKERCPDVEHCPQCEGIMK